MHMFILADMRLGACMCVDSLAFSTYMWSQDERYAYEAIDENTSFYLQYKLSPDTDFVSCNASDLVDATFMDYQQTCGFYSWITNRLAAIIATMSIASYRSNPSEPSENHINNHHRCNNFI